MAGSVLTFFLNNPLQSGSSAGALDLVQPATSTSTTGWIVGTNAAGNFSNMTYGTKKARTTFTTTAQPSGAPVTLAGHLAEDYFRSSVATTGDFSAGTWYSGASVIAVTAAGTDQDRIRVRLWRSANVDGTSATEITKGAMVGTTVTPSTTVAATSSASTHVGAFSLANEYLFYQCAVETVVAGGGTTRDCLFRFGAISSNVAGSFLATSAFSVTGGGGGTTPSGVGYWTRAQDWLLDS